VRPDAPFQQDDLTDLGRLLARAADVVAMRDVYNGDTNPTVIGMRHDVDNYIEPAVWMAEWEAARGYRSTYYILHTAPYWTDKELLKRSLERISSHGHEIGIHNNAIAEAHRTGRRPADILQEAIGELRWMGYPVNGTVAHGDPDCYDAKRNIRFVNDQMFTDCVRPDLTNPVETHSLDSFGLDYDANWLKRGCYLSDSGGRWSAPFDSVANRFPHPGQLHMLVHPDWWDQAFKAAA